MKNKALLILPIVTFLIAGCGRKNNSSSTTSTTSQSTSEAASSSHSTTSQSTSLSITSSATSSSKTSSSSSSSSITTSSQPVPITISIKEAIALGNAHAVDVPPGSHEFFGETITTSGRAIQNIAIGINQAGLTYICDGKDIIPCFGGTGSNTLYDKCSNYIDKDTSNYTVTGQIGFYYSMPCIKITSFVLHQDMKFNIDYKSLTYDDYDSISSYNSFLEGVDYNKKGYGESSLIKLTNVVCLAKEDNNSWLVSDGTHAQNVYHQVSNTSLTNGTQYNLYGISCLYKWRPSLRILAYEVSTGPSIDVDVESLAISKTATEMYSIGCPKDDLEKCEATTNFIKTYKYFYKSDLYFNYYESNGNGYVVAGDNYYSSRISSQTTAKNNKMFLFNNKSYNKWQSTKNVPVANWLLENTKLTSYYVEYQFTKNDGVMMPQIYMLENYIPN